MTPESRKPLALRNLIRCGAWDSAAASLDTLGHIAPGCTSEPSSVHQQYILNPVRNVGQNSSNLGTTATFPCVSTQRRFDMQSVMRLVVARYLQVGMHGNGLNDEQVLRVTNRDMQRLSTAKLSSPTLTGCLTRSLPPLLQHAKDQGCIKQHSFRKLSTSYKAWHTSNHLYHPPREGTQHSPLDVYPTIPS